MAASTGVASGSPRQTGMPSASLRQRTPNRPNHMSLSNLLNDEGPPQKLQRTGGDHDVWCSSSRNATANFESNGRYAPPTSPMGPPGVNTAGIQGVLNNNTPEPEKAAPVSGEKRAYVTGGPKIICDTCKESFTCDSLLRYAQVPPPFLSRMDTSIALFFVEFPLFSLGCQANSSECLRCSLKKTSSKAHQTVQMQGKGM